MTTLHGTIIIPSHNRAALLAQVLEGLAAQTIDPAFFEVVVVLDGCTDGSEVMLTAWQARNTLPHLRWLRQPQRGQAAARMAGAAQARAPILAFLDDDIVPESGWLKAHLDRHAEQGGLVVLGGAHLPRTARDSLYHLITWAWWEDTYHARAQQSHPPTYRDFCAGNVSLRREDFMRVGGFDTAFTGYGGEDYDLGYRLLQAGRQFVTEPLARAVHHHRATMMQTLRQTRQEGANDLRLGSKHPALISRLRLAHRPRFLVERWAVHAIFAVPWAYDALATVACQLLPLLEQLNLQTTWFTWFRRLRHGAYWRGVREGVGSWQALEAFRARAPHRRVSVEITEGLPPSQLFDGELPEEVEIIYRGRSLGVVRVPEASKPWAEALATAIGTQCTSSTALLFDALGHHP